MGKPSVVSRSGQSSSISFVREFIYPSEYEPPEFPTARAIMTTSAFCPTEIVGGGRRKPRHSLHPDRLRQREIGVTMEVLPVVDPAKRFVNVTLNPTFTDFDGYINYGTPINTTERLIAGAGNIDLTQTRS